MRKLFIVPIVLLTILASCKKDNSTALPIGTIVATIDGVVDTFNVNDSAVIEYTPYVDPSPYRAVFAAGGSESSSDPSNDIVLIIASIPQSIKTGTYSDSTGSYEAAILYQHNADDVTYQTTHSPYNSTINITSMSSSSVQGTFSGQLMLAPGNISSITTHTITNGKFNLPLAYFYLP